MRTSREIWLCPGCHRRHRAEECEEAAMLEEMEEETAVRVEMIESGDYAALVEYLEGKVARRRGCAYTAKNLGEAYVLAGEPEKAIALLAPVHRREPDFEDVQIVLLDALFALGRDESDFVWENEIPVIRLAAPALATCLRYLERKAAAVEVGDLYCELLSCGYCTFTEEELLAAIGRDGRFVVEAAGPETMVWRKRAAGRW